MLKQIIEAEKLARLKELVSEAHDIIITCHISPDGDAMGSSLGLARALSLQGKRTTVFTPDTPPRYLHFLPGADGVRPFQQWKTFGLRKFAEADLIFCLDYNEPKRIDLMAETMLASPAKKVMIDHHLYPDEFPDLTISHPEEASTSQLVYRVLMGMGMSEFIDRGTAECIYTGMMTDTGNFCHNANSPELFLIVADLIERGINRDAIYKSVYFNSSVNRLRLNGYALSEKLDVFPEHHTALITLSRDELNSFNYQKGDTEDLVNQPLTVPQIACSVFMREESNYIKISMRSKDTFPVNKICSEHFNGGGHLNAAGGEFFGTMEEAVDTLLRAMPFYDQYLPQQYQNP